MKISTHKGTFILINIIFIKKVKLKDISIIISINTFKY